MPTCRRVLVSVLFGLVTGLFGYMRYADLGGAGDFTWALRIARDVLAGNDPYAFTPTAATVPYPIPVALFGLPFVVVPDAVAGALFFGGSSALLAFGILRSGETWRLCLFLSYPYLHALIWAQFSVIVAAAWFFPLLAPLLVFVKPQTALPVALNRLSLRGVALAAVVLLMSFAMYPTWPFRWVAMIGAYQRIIPVAVLPFGPLLLLAALWWRDERARLLLGMAVLPFRAHYDLCILWLVPRVAWQAWLLTALSWSYALLRVGSWQAWIVVSLFLPALAFTLWPLIHPHVAEVPRRAKSPKSAS